MYRKNVFTYRGTTFLSYRTALVLKNKAGVGKPASDPALGFLSVWSFSACAPRVGFIQGFSSFLSPSK